MAFYTVQQLKTAVANIPPAANSWIIEIPDDLIVPVSTSRTFAVDGTKVLDIRGYLNLSDRSWTPVNP